MSPPVFNIPHRFMEDHKVYDNLETELHDALHSCNWFLENTKDSASLLEYCSVISELHKKYSEFCATYFSRLVDEHPLHEFVVERSKEIINFTDESIKKVSGLVFTIKFFKPSDSEEMCEFDNSAMLRECEKKDRNKSKRGCGEYYETIF